MNESTKQTSDSRDPIEKEDSFPTGESHWHRGAEIARYLRDRLFLKALYKDDRTVDIMYRYLSGQTLRKIGKTYGISGERVRQICSWSIFQLRHLLVDFKNDVMDKKADKDDPNPEDA